jgi:uncharacterized phage infection (PIP) family protein YhgE
MRETAGRVTEAQTARLQLADEFEAVALAMPEQVATASTEMSASAAGLAGAASAASAQTGTAQQTMDSLTRSSAEIRDVVALTERVTAQVEQIRQACEEVAAVMDEVGTTVSEMNGLVDGIAAAVDGSASLGTGSGDITGLSQMAERLRSEATGFLAEMRR